jgi:hypothetical protein
MNMSDEYSIKVSQFETSFNQPVACGAASIKLHDYVIVFDEDTSTGATRCNIG